MRRVLRFFRDLGAIASILLWLLLNSLPAHAQGFCIPLGSVLPIEENVSVINSGAAGSFGGCFSAPIELGGSYSVIAVAPTTALINSIIMRNSAGTIIRQMDDVGLGEGFGSFFADTSGLHTFSIAASGPTFTAATIRFESFAAVVPEPNSIVLFAAGLGVMLLLYRRQHSRQLRPATP